MATTYDLARLDGPGRGRIEFSIRSVYPGVHVNREVRLAYRAVESARAKAGMK